MGAGRDLVTHVGTAHRFAASIIESGEQQPYRKTEAPAEQAAWPEWLVAGARRLTGAVRERGFDGSAWTWHPRQRTAGFWLRRMTHDQVVHRVDAEAGDDIAADLAADGVSDLLLSFEMFNRLAGGGETLAFAAVDTGDSWHVTRVPGGVQWRAGEAAADARVAAPARDLLLILNRRMPPPEVEGDRAVWDAWREAARF